MSTIPPGKPEKEFILWQEGCCRETIIVDGIRVKKVFEVKEAGSSEWTEIGSVYLFYSEIIKTIHKYPEEFGIWTSVPRTEKEIEEKN